MAEQQTATPKAEAASKATPAWRASLRTHWQGWLLRLLALCIIWGVAAFGMGSLDTLARSKAAKALAFETAAYAGQLKPWLENPLLPLQALAQNATLQEALSSPLGLAHPAMQRLLNTYALENKTDLVMADLASGRTLTAPGSTPPPPDVFSRLATLMETGLHPTLLSTGTRNGMLYFVAPLPSSAGQLNIAIAPLGLRQVAGGWPVASERSSTAFALELPHTLGTASWQASTPLRLNVPVPLTVKGLPTHKIFLPWLPDVSLAGAYTQPPALADIKIKGLIVLWALLTSLWVLWKETAPLRNKVKSWVAPYLAPLLSKLSGPLSKGIAALNQGLKPLGAMGWNGVKNIKNIFAKTKTLPAEDELSWRDAYAHEMLDDEPLTEGPGGYMPSDFAAKTLKPARKSGVKLTTSHTTDKAQPILNPSDNFAPEEELALADTTNDATLDKLTHRVKKCLKQGLLEVMYQPLYQSDTNTPFANEVLARLVDAEGPISPAQFMPVLEQQHLVAALDALVFEKVLAEHFITNGMAAKTPATHLSLNISGTSLEDLDYLRDVAKQGPAILKSLIFEVRSNEIIRDPNALNLLKALQRQGARVAVDYFGGGTTMIEATHALGLNFIKLDAMRLTESRSNKKEMVEICQLANTLGLPVVIERIENWQIESFARRAGASYLQGYGLCRPSNTLSTLPLSARMDRTEK